MHQSLLRMTGSKRGDAEFAKDFAKKPRMDWQWTTVVFILNHAKPCKHRVFLCELRVSAFR